MVIQEKAWETVMRYGGYMQIQTEYLRKSGACPAGESADMDT